MAKTYVHIGAPKTGSTAIQRFMTEHRLQLHERGLLYPETSLRGFGHHDLAFLLDGGYPAWATPQDEPLDTLVEGLRHECADGSGDASRDVLLSSEDFYLFPQPEALAGLLHDAGLDDDREVRIVVYVRRQDELLVSWYNQQVKAQGFTGTFEESVDASAWMGDFDVELGRWAAVYGDAQLDVRLYDAGPSPDALLRDFLSIVCPDALELLTDAAVEPVNTRLSRDLLELQRILNRLPVPVVEKRSLHRDLIALANEDHFDFDDTPVASGGQLDAVMAGFAAGNEALANRFFDGEPVFGDRMSRPAEGEPYAGLDIDTVVSVFGWLLLRR